MYFRSFSHAFWANSEPAKRTPILSKNDEKNVILEQKWKKLRHDHHSGISSGLSIGGIIASEV